MIILGTIITIVIIKGKSKMDEIIIELFNLINFIKVIFQIQIDFEIHYLS
jgi:hypothetical protein